MRTLGHAKYSQREARYAAGSSQPWEAKPRRDFAEPTSWLPVLSIHLDRSFFIGRAIECDYTIAHPAASSKHCRLYALQVDTGEVLVCLEDTSTNGTLFNQRKISRGTVILSDGDTIESADRDFEMTKRCRCGRSLTRAFAVSGSLDVVSATNMLLPLRH